MVHRVDLHNRLKQRASETATLHTGCTIVKIDIDNSLVVLDDGREFTADVLLGADGAHVLWLFPFLISPAYYKEIIKANEVDKCISPCFESISRQVLLLHIQLESLAFGGCFLWTN